MKVIFNCRHFKFHADYCYNIIDELESRGHMGIISNTEEIYEDADFTIQPDESCKRQGGKGIWINHAFPFVPQNRFYLTEKFKEDITTNSDFIFTFSEAWKDNHLEYGLPIKIVGMPKLDKLFNNTKTKTTILYSPTWNKDLSSLGKIDLKRLEKFGEVIFRGHPAFHENKVSFAEAMKKATIVISDYSSVGLEAIVLNIPTILFESNDWKNMRSEHISNKSMSAAICVDNQKSLEDGIKQFLAEPDFLKAERLHYSRLLCEHQGMASKVFVDELEKLHLK